MAQKRKNHGSDGEGKKNEGGAEIVKFPFYGDELDVVRDESGVWLSIPRASANLGLRDQGQVTKLQGKPWARVQMKCIPDARGIMQETSCIHIDSLPMWLATIESSRVTPAFRPKLVAYHTEASRVLRDHFIGRPEDTSRTGLARVAAALNEFRLMLDEANARLAKLQLEHDSVRAELAQLTTVNARITQLEGLIVPYSAHPQRYHTQAPLESDGPKTLEVQSEARLWEKAWQAKGADFTYRKALGRITEHWHPQRGSYKSIPLEFADNVIEWIKSEAAANPPLHLMAKDKRTQRELKKGVALRQAKAKQPMLGGFAELLAAAEAETKAMRNKPN